LEDGSKMQQGVNCCQRKQDHVLVKDVLINVSPIVVMPVVGLVLLSRPSFFFLYFCGVNRHWPLRFW